MIKRSDYEHLPKTSYRTNTGRLVTTYDAPDGDLYVKVVDAGVHVQKVTPEQWERAVVNHKIEVSNAD